MKFIPQSIPDVFLIKNSIIKDNRGYFLETFRQNLLEKAVGYKINFVQENESKSTIGVLRGLHYQMPQYAQAKLVKVTEGEVLDVAVDIRKSSPTFGRYVAVKLTRENKYQLFIPRGFAHGYVLLSDIATFNYKVDNYYAPENECGIAFNDKDLKIDWKLPLDHLKLSAKDKSNPSFANARYLFE